MLSAKLIILLRGCTGLKDDALIIKDDGLNTEPWTTLELIDKALEVLLRNFVERVLFKKNEMSELWILSSSYNENMLVMRVE